MTADRKLDKRLKHECLRCTEQALPDSDFCGPHRDDERRRAREGMKKRRRKFRHKGKCADCGRGSKKWRCRTCYEKWKEGRAGTVTTRSDNVTKARDRRFRTETGPNFRGVGTYQTQRYLGKGRRGRLTRQEQAEEDKRDARFAIAEIEKFIVEATRLAGDDVLELPRIQREAERRKALLYLGNAGRFIDELAEKYA
jgi:hypothetical protein